VSDHSVFRLILEFTGNLAKAAKVALGLAELLPEELLNVPLRPALAGVRMLGSHHDHRAVQDPFLRYLDYRPGVRHRVREPLNSVLPPGTLRWEPWPPLGCRANRSKG
jgi:hypothetical protein